MQMWFRFAAHKSERISCTLCHHVLINAMLLVYYWVFSSKEPALYVYVYIMTINYFWIWNILKFDILYACVSWMKRCSFDKMLLKYVLHRVIDNKQSLVQIIASHRTGARPTDDISIEFEIRPKYAVLWFKMYSADHNGILHTSRQSNCRDVCNI